MVTDPTGYGLSNEAVDFLVVRHGPVRRRRRALLH
jgi:hypothetical protein